MTPGTLEADRLTSELVSFENVFSTKPFSTLTASMSLLRIPSMLALHVSLQVVISAEADITQVTHVLRIVIHLTLIHVVVIQVVVIHPEVHTTESHRQLRPVGWWGSIYRVKNVWKSFWHCTTSWGNCISHILFLEHDSFISDILQTFFRDVKQTSVGFPMPPYDLLSVNLTAPVGFPWPGWPHHLVVTGCLCHKGSGALQPDKEIQLV